jgi:hypothetical protein
MSLIQLSTLKDDPATAIDAVQGAQEDTSLENNAASVCNGYWITLWVLAWVCLAGWICVIAYQVLKIAMRGEAKTEEKGQIATGYGQAEEEDTECKGKCSIEQAVVCSQLIDAFTT